MEDVLSPSGGAGEVLGRGRRPTALRRQRCVGALRRRSRLGLVATRLPCRANPDSRSTSSPGTHVPVIIAACPPAELEPHRDHLLGAGLTVMVRPCTGTSSSSGCSARLSRRALGGLPEGQPVDCLRSLGFTGTTSPEPSSAGSADITSVAHPAPAHPWGQIAGLGGKPENGGLADHQPACRAGPRRTSTRGTLTGKRHERIAVGACPVPAHPDRRWCPPCAGGAQDVTVVRRASWTPPSCRPRQEGQPRLRPPPEALEGLLGSSSSCQSAVCGSGRCRVPGRHRAGGEPGLGLGISVGRRSRSR